MPVTPYNTGKIKIGCYYVPPQQNYTTAETEHWQNVFLGEHRRERRDSLRFWVMACCIGALCFVLFGFR